MGRILVLAVTIVACGCARRVVRPDLVIPVECASAIRLVGCDAGVSPPRCRSVRVRYRAGCERVVVVK